MNINDLLLHLQLFVVWIVVKVRAILRAPVKLTGSKIIIEMMMMTTMVIMMIEDILIEQKIHK